MSKQRTGIRWFVTTILACSTVGLIPNASRAAESPKPELVSVRKIWDQAPHNAFTDLIRFKAIARRMKEPVVADQIAASPGTMTLSCGV